MLTIVSQGICGVIKCAMTITVRSFAKINLGLRIGAPREDGFHELLTVYQTIGLHDVISGEARAGQRD